MILTIVYALLAIAAVSAGMYYLRGPLLGMLVTFAVQLGMRKTFKTFQLGIFNIIPFGMFDFSVSIYATRKSPEMNVSWKSFRILMDITKIFDPLLSLLNVLPNSTDKNAVKRTKMIRFVFEGFKASSPGLSFADFLDPPENKMPPPEGPFNENGDAVLPGDSGSSGAISYVLIMKRLMQHIVLFVDIEFQAFCFDFQFPTHESHMVGTAKVMTISFPRPPSTSSDTVSVLNSVDGGEMEITQSGERAMFYMGQEGKISVDLHLPTGVMDVLMRVLGREHDLMFVTIAPFIEFYKRYTHAEDNSVEIKMARGLSTGGKMAMRLECEYIDVCVTDHRCPDVLRMTMQQLEGELKTYSLTRANERMYKEKRYTEQADGTSGAHDVTHKLYNFFMRDKDADAIVMSPNKEKVMKAGIKRLDFHTNSTESTAFVEEASMIKTKRVYNENDFVDTDRMNAYAKCIHFEKISPAMLDWLIVLQDAANRMPDSRFAHKKDSEMHFLAITFRFSSQPVSFAYIPPPVDPPPQGSGPAARSDPPLETLDGIPVDADHWACFKFTNMQAKRELPHNEVDSLIDLQSGQFTIETSLPQHCLAEQYTLTAVGDYDLDSSEAQSVASAHSSEAEQLFYEAPELDIEDRQPFSFADVYDTADGTGSGGAFMEEGVSNHYPKLSQQVLQDTVSTSAATANPLSDKASPEQKSPTERHGKKSQSKASTGTVWTFPGFSVRMKLGAKMHLEWVKAHLMKIEFSNSPAGDVLLADPPSPSVVRDPFVQTSTLCALWCGLSVTADLGNMQMKGSVAGVLKAQTGYLMIRKTADRITARMTYMKLRGGPPVVVHPVHHGPGSAADLSALNAEPPPPKTTVRITDFIIDVPIEISPEDQAKRMHHELDREQRQILRHQQMIEKMRSRRRNSHSSQRSDATDLAESPLVIPMSTPSTIDRSDKALKFMMRNFEYSSAVGESTAAFESCNVSINSYPEKPWMVLAGLKYRKAVVPLETDDAFYQGLDIQSSVEAAVITMKTVTEVFFENFDMHLSARMEIGIIADSLLAQDAAFKIASTVPRKKRLPLPASPRLRSLPGGQLQAPDAQDALSRSGSVSPTPSSDRSPSYWEGSVGNPSGSSRERVGSDFTADMDGGSATSSGVLAMEHPQDWAEEPELAELEPEYESSLHEEDMELTKPNPTVMHVIMKAFNIIYDAHYNNDYIEEFMKVEQMGFDLMLDSTKMPSATQDEITSLDLGSEGAEEDRQKLASLRSQAGGNSASPGDNSNGLLVYTSVFGGQLKFYVKFLTVRLKMLKDPFVEAEDVTFSGPVYNAAVKDPRIIRAEVLVALGDSVPCYAFDDDHQDGITSGRMTHHHHHHHAAASPAAVLGSTEPLYVTLMRSAAPAKVYMDLTMAGSSMTFCMNSATMECVNAVNAVMDCVLPPNKDPSPQFVPWDMWRYLLHGSFTFSFSKMAVQYSSHDYMTQKVTLLVSMEVPKWYMDKGSFSLTAQNVLVEAQINTTLLGGRRNHTKKQQQKQHSVTSKLCSVPAFILSLTHFRDDVRSKFASSDNTPCTEYSHHDVYLRPAMVAPFSLADAANLALEDYKYLNTDKYFHFRSQPMSIRWEIEMRLADSDDVPISANFRLDHLVRVMDAFKAPEEDLTQRADPLDACLDKASDYFYGVVKPLAPIPLGDMVSVLKLQLILNKIMISSWPSATNLGGIVMTIGSSDLQLRLLRDISPEFTEPPPPNTIPVTKSSRSARRTSQSSYEDERSTQSERLVPIFPLKIDHLYMDTAYIELYVRSWHLGPADSPLRGRRPSSFRLNDDLKSSAAGVSEPSTPDEIESLFVPIYKNAHSTKMVISLTESGVVCTRELLFSQSGILEKCSERLKKATIKPSRISRKFTAGTALASATEGSTTAVFLIGKDWKEHLVKVAAAASQSSNNLASRLYDRGGMGRRPSALSLFMAAARTSKSSLESPSLRRGSVLAADIPGTRRKSVARRASQINTDTKRRGRMRADSIDTIGSGFSHTPFNMLPGNNRLSNQRNRRSSVRGGFKPERGSIREAPWDPLVDGYRASLLSFSTNHSAFTPPQHALPLSYSLSKAGFVQGRIAQQGSRVAAHNEDASSFGTKIWGLRITDLRLLFTIEIRDVLFNYFARGMDLFQAPAEGQPDVPRRRPSAVEAKLDKDGGKATIYDFLQATDQEPANQRKAQSAEERNRFGFSPLRAMHPLQTTMEASSDAMLQFLSSRQDRVGSTPRSNKEMTEMLQQGTSSGAGVTAHEKARFQKGGRALTRENSGSIHFQESTKSPAKKALDDSDSEADANTPGLSIKVPSTPTTPRPTGSPKFGPVPATPVRTPAVTSAKERVSIAGAIPEPAKGAKNKKPTSQYFFIVELIDPQVNFLDVKTHSSLIIVAGLSSLEGKRYTDATVPPNHDGAGAVGGANIVRGSLATPARGSVTQALPEPKRQQEVRLRMDGVSAFTVPSNSSNDPNDESDTVHWKHMVSTSGIGLDDSGYLGHRRGTTVKESPFMRMAIKDFQIRALYIFWTDVTVKEAKTMYLNPSKEDLVCTFKLELPVICVDILSWQFYVIMHVIRNVLLVPPPASATRKSATQSEAEDAEKNKVLELVRDPVLLSKHEMRANLNAALDLKHKHSRDELKLLIEENLAGAMMNMELGSARFVEVFVGSCTWILRVNSGSPYSTAGMNDSSVNGKEGSREWEKEQLKVELTGAHATFSYGEDRSASSLFEVQRFWAKDMDPGRDMLLITKSSSHGSRRKPSVSGTGKDDGKLDSVVMMPILSQTEHCARCGAAFLLEENHAMACTFHANQDGDPGEYKDVVITDELTGVQSVLKAWTCCGRHHAFAAGCSARPHTCKEVMIQIRAEANPTTRVENIDLSILKSVDISIFPNSTYDLQVHITKSLADVLHKYFSIDDMENYEITASYVETAEPDEKQSSHWKRVKNVGKMLRRKNKTNAGELGDEGMFSGDEPSPGPSSPMYDGAGNSPFFSPPTSPVPPAPPTTPKGSATKGSAMLSPWFRSSTPKRVVTPGAVPSSGASVSTEDSAPVRATSRSRMGFSLGGLFSRTKTDAPDPRRTASEDAVQSELNANGQMTFNMMRKRTNTTAAAAAKVERRSITGTNDSSGPNGAADQPAEQKSTTAVSTRRQEGVYVKFLRLGGIQIEVSTAGFMLNLNKFKAQMDEFRCQGEVLPWNRLIANMERHMAVSLFTNAASNSLSRFTQLFRFSGTAATEVSGVSSADGSSTQAKKATFVKWEKVEDPSTAMSLKRSALGLPPTKVKSSLDQKARAESSEGIGNKEAEPNLAGKFLLGPGNGASNT